MKVSLNMVRYYQQLFKWSDDPAPDGPEKLIEKIGAQLGGVEEILYPGKKYDGVIIAKVISCVQHPNADRLHVCAIDDGGMAADVQRDESGHVTVVCGAPNVREGLTVAWLPPGSTVPNSADTDPFVLEARELRGVVSNGMLASPKELALGDSHDGILEIEDEVAPGTMFADHYNLRGDVVIDIENKMFTHRPDCFGMLGVAREIAGIQGQKFTSPEWYKADAQLPEAGTGTLKVEVRNEIPELVPRFVAVPMDNITIGPSPVWLQVELTRLGAKPINNIVDLTNYHMLVTGQPIHAYDYDKVNALSGGDHAVLTVRFPRPGEKIPLLNGKEIEPRPEAMMVAAGDTLVCLGGAMGGTNSEVDSQTTRIIIEAANWDMFSMRRTAMAHGIFTDAVTRFTKGQSPLQNRAVVSRLVDDIQRLSGGQVAGPAIDDKHLAPEVLERKSLYPDVTVSADFINTRLGLRLGAADMAELLTNVEFSVHVAVDNLTVRAPFWRTDIEIAEDIVEEVGRLYGYDKLPLDLPVRDLTPASRNQLFEAKNAIRQSLSKAGANEVLTYSFVHGNLLNKTGQDTSLAFQLGNALSPDLQYYRLSLTPSLLDKVHANIKAGFNEFAIFEIGKVHSKSEMGDDGLPTEFGRVALTFAANPKAAEAYAGAPYFHAKLYATNVLGSFGVAAGALMFLPLASFDFQGHQLAQQLAAPFAPQRSAVLLVGGKLAGVVGEYQAAVRQKLKLPDFSAGFELFVSTFTTATSDATRYATLPRFPKVEQDICFKLIATTTYQDLYVSVTEALATVQPKRTLSAVSLVDIYQRDDDTDHKQITVRFSIASYDKTMTDTEVVALLGTVADATVQKLGAEII